MGERGGARHGPTVDRRGVVLRTGASLGLLAFPNWRRARVIEPPSEPGPDDLMRFFDTLALMRGHAPGEARAGWVRKWTAPVAVVLDGMVSAPARAGVAAALADLSRWSGVPFGLAREAADGNTLAIRIVPREAMAESYQRSGAVCMTTTFGHGGRLESARVEVSARYADCLLHELMHALGFDNHWYGRGVAAAMPSVLAPRRTAARARSFTRWDVLAIRVLYHPNLRPGMPRHLALPVARRVMAALSA